MQNKGGVGWLIAPSAIDGATDHSAVVPHS